MSPFKRNWILYILDSIYIQYKLSTRTICPWTNLKRHVLHLLDTVFLAEKTGYFLVIQNKFMVSNQSRLAQINFIFKLVWSFYFIFWLFACLVRAHSYNNYTLWTIHEQSCFIVKTRTVRAVPRHHPGCTRTPEVLLKWSGKSWSWN